MKNDDTMVQHKGGKNVLFLMTMIDGKTIIIGDYQKR
jgi:hypothetical protein